MAHMILLSYWPHCNLFNMSFVLVAKLNTTIPPQGAIEEHMEAQPEAEPDAQEEEFKFPVQVLTVRFVSNSFLVCTSSMYLPPW